MGDFKGFLHEYRGAIIRWNTRNNCIMYRTFKISTSSNGTLCRSFFRKLCTTQ